MREALFYEKLPHDVVRCELCRHRCRIAPGMRGICRVRENRTGQLMSLVYGRIVAEHVDPVEKKPLFHVLPGTESYSIATVGCNFRCRHCQNHTIAQYEPRAAAEIPGHPTTPQQIVERALESGCRSISYTYTEPTIFCEYALDCARLASAAGLKNIFVTNGYITPRALDAVAPFLDAANIDLKGFSDDFYQRVVGAQLGEVLECIRDYHRRGIWIEITTLVIPGENDSDDQLNGIARFIADELGCDVPWHISRFFPQYRMTDREPTPSASLTRAVEAGRRAGLHFLYVGNQVGGRENTDCPACGAMVISRGGFQIFDNRLVGKVCPQCGAGLAGIFC
ncbi:AmmeMemoRadiSam system radical SAM enzyme [Geobacter sp. AOG2]|uniref:AmmeMemoRadiSam system radical SAM enzyme n=1 Tax=Geobacter sp. AOG2 TaxID=1566347 RepID=UPI001CC62625|nr:AmmeMemoRadiSam system radical SAM enzyme [Geobacter sp. AOG2]GFE60511.1 AmmeMemoRadiSam system radical SAM enzyme [Geobacter sp. AOG2]